MYVHKQGFDLYEWKIYDYELKVKLENNLLLR